MSSLTALEACIVLLSESLLIHSPTSTTSTMARRALDHWSEALGLFVGPQVVCTYFAFLFLRCPSLIFGSHDFPIISCNVRQTKKLTSSLISAFSMLWYWVFVISLSVAYYGISKDLSLNMAVISVMVSIIWCKSWDSLSSCYTSTVGANSTWNLVTKLGQVIASIVDVAIVNPAFSH